MAYIDRDKMIASLKESRDRAVEWHNDCIAYSSEDQDRSEQAIMTFNECILRVKEQPTADVVERKKGRWIQRSDSPYYYECSNCRRVIIAARADQIERFHAFCGTCGADMREETEDEKT